MVTVKWKHSASTNQWRGVRGPSTTGFVVLTRPPSVPLKKVLVKVPVPIVPVNPFLLNLYRQCPRNTATSSFT